MIYVLAAIGALSIAVLMWRAFGPDRIAAEGHRKQRRAVAPDDDPDFLRRIGEQQRKNRDEGEAG